MPITLTGQDVAGQAQTGTGKTLAFLASTFHHLLSFPVEEGKMINQPRALIMVPARELALQLHAEAVSLSQSSGLKLGLAYGVGMVMINNLRYWKRALK